MANFEAFRWNFSSSINLFFLKSEYVYCMHCICKYETNFTDLLKLGYYEKTSDSPVCPPSLGYRALTHCCVHKLYCSGLLMLQFVILQFFDHCS